MSNEGLSTPARLLVVEADPTLRQALLRLLSEEGYAPFEAASLEEAWDIVDTSSFALILADLYVGRSRFSFTPAHLLRRHTPGTPLGILTNEAVSPWDEQWSAFVFALSKPVDAVRLLTEIAACLKRPFSSEQREQVAVLRRFVEAIVHKAWSRLSGMCTERVSYYPPEAFSLFPIRPLRGRMALRAYAASVWQDAPHLRLEILEIYSRPRGLALRYLIYAAAPDGGWAWQENTEVFQFLGKRISQIGLPDDGRSLLNRCEIPQIG